MALKISAESIMIAKENSKLGRIEEIFRSIENKIYKWNEGEEKFLGISIAKSDGILVDEIIKELNSKGFKAESLETDLQIVINFRW